MSDRYKTLVAALIRDNPGIDEDYLGAIYNEGFKQGEEEARKEVARDVKRVLPDV